VTNDAKTKGWSAIVTAGPHSTVKIDGEIPYEALEKHRAAALAELGKNVSVDGFRKGHIPEKVLLDRVGEMALLTEMAERALARAYPEIVSEHALDVIGRPDITITKIAKNNPFGFSARVAVVPEVILPDYKKIAREIPRNTDETPEVSSGENPAEALASEKAVDATARHRAALTDAIIEMSTIDIPQVLIDAELGQMFGQMEHDLKRANLSIGDYLGHIKKTKEELVKEWVPAAEKRAKLQLILNEIAKKEHIEASAEKVGEEVTHLLAHYKDADENRVTLYVASTLINEEVLKMLEKQSE
jgi:FKBP-type peptidyl-prolyl cis-trans isomerase (trigger factor)